MKIFRLRKVFVRSVASEMGSDSFFDAPGYLALAAPHPAKLLFRVPLPNGGFFAVLEKVGHPQVFGAVPVSPGVYPAGVPEEVCREALVEAVPFQGVGAEAAGVG